MCFDPGRSRPPELPSDGLAGVPAGMAEVSDLVFSGADGSTRRAVRARPAHRRTDAVVVILPDGRGLHQYYQELATRLAETGVEAIALDYYSSVYGPVSRPPDFEHGPHAKALSWATVRADLEAVLDIAHDPGRGRPVVALGFCLGGRLALLAASEPTLGLAGVVAAYADPCRFRAGNIPAPVECADQISGRVMLVSAGADQLVPAEVPLRYVAALQANSVDHEHVVYPAAPHAFFDRHAEQYAVESADLWRRLLAFI